MNMIILSIGILIGAVFVIRWVLPNILFHILKKTLPPISDTERQAIDAGTLSYEKGIFAGKPDWEHLLHRPLSTLSDEEQAFVDGPVKRVTAMLDDYNIRKTSQLPDEVWHVLKESGFFGFIVTKEYGGLHFSAAAISRIVSEIGTKSFATAIMVMVPSALGPAKLLLKFGTPKQRDTYLPKLASGEHIPCFALTGVTSGSDAASMRDVGIITKIKHGDSEKLVIRANFSKRYITLAPIATLIGLGIDVYDPDSLLGDDYPYLNLKNKQVGITVLLINRDQDGIEIGNRHIPSGVGFINGTIRGRDVDVDFDQIIGGQEYLGKGWVMIMSCLGVGRALSLPSRATGGMEFATCYTLLYAGMRKQFNLPIAKMEAVSERLADSVYLHYINRAAKNLCYTLVDDGENPAVASALIKYASTNDLRRCNDNCMDILSGKAVMDGPTNPLQNIYQSIPVGITVEGANILTRGLITFSQGAIRAHPYLFEEIEALYDKNPQQAKKKFANIILRHIGFTVANGVANMWHNATRGVFLSVPSGITAPNKHYRLVTLQTKQFAFLADVTLLLLGGKIKAKQAISGRCADILKNVYYAMAVLKQYESDQTPKTHAILDYSMQRLAYENTMHIQGVIQNLPNAMVRGMLRLTLFPLSRIITGVGETPPKDSQGMKILQGIYQDNDLMHHLFKNVFDSNMVDELYADYQLLQNAEPLYKKLKPLIQSGEIVCGYDRDWLDLAHQSGHISHNELAILKQAELAYYKHMNVDEFESDARTYAKNIDTNLSNERAV